MNNTNLSGLEFGRQKIHTRFCVVCNLEIRNVASNRKYCSDTCQLDGKRQAWERYRNKEKSKIIARKGNWRRRYGIIEEEYRSILEKQNNVCAICKKQETRKVRGGGKRNFSVDHCHKTGKVRGLLCDACNKGLGQFNDDIELICAAFKYLEDL